jgi:Alpha-L-fucosidase
MAPRIVLAAIVVAVSVVAAQGRATWMREARLGVMTHYLADWRSRTDHVAMTVETWNQLVDEFDVDGLAAQLASAGVKYHILTIGQNSGYYAAPNAEYDRLTGIRPSKCSRRDLVADMSAALAKRGIRLIAYLPAGAPNSDSAARTALEWENGAHPNQAFQAKWEQVIREWSVRWGTKVSGWWFDGCYWPNTMYRSVDPPNFQSFAAAARAGNPASILAFNPGVVPRLISMTPHEDFTAGEQNDPARVEIRRAENGLLDGVQLHVLSYLGEQWGMGEPRFTTEQAVAFSEKIRSAGAAMTWDVPVQKNGLISNGFLDQLTAIGASASRPVSAESMTSSPAIGRQ